MADAKDVIAKLEGAERGLRRVGKRNCHWVNVNVAIFETGIGKGRQSPFIGVSKGSLLVGVPENATHI